MNLNGYLEDSKKPLVSLVLVLPLVMFYNVGLILTNWEALNGADFITLSIVHLLGREGFLWFQAGLAVLFLSTLCISNDSRTFRSGYFFRFWENLCCMHYRWEP